jgi:hypothetical protein
MPADTYEVQSNYPELKEFVCKFVGGTAAVTKTFGPGLTVTYISAGVVDVTVPTGADRPGDFIGVGGYCFEATTPANVKSYVLVPGVFNTSTGKLRLSMYESGTLTDLAALEWLSVKLLFSTVD